MTISCIYHALAKNNGKRVLRVLDHDFVFFLVAGTYTPFCLISMRELPLWGIEGTNWSGWLIFALVWSLIALGITMNSVNIKKFGVLSMTIYICAGWLIIFNCVELFNQIGLEGFLLLLFDGRIIIIRTYSCPASTISTTLSVRRSMPSGSYFLVRLAPNSMANA